MRNVKAMQMLANLVSGKTIAKIMAKDVYGTGGFEIVFDDGRVLELFLVPGESEILWCVSPKDDIPQIELEFNDQIHCNHV